MRRAREVEAANGGGGDRRGRRREAEQAVDMAEGEGLERRRWRRGRHTRPSDGRRRDGDEGDGAAVVRSQGAGDGRGSSGGWDEWEGGDGEIIDDQRGVGGKEGGGDEGAGTTRRRGRGRGGAQAVRHGGDPEPGGGRRPVEGCDLLVEVGVGGEERGRGPCQRCYHREFQRQEGSGVRLASRQGGGVDGNGDGGELTRATSIPAAGWRMRAQWRRGRGRRQGWWRRRCPRSRGGDGGSGWWRWIGRRWREA